MTTSSSQIQIQTTTLLTRHANLNISYTEAPNRHPDHPALLLIHGNSFCSQIFQHMLTSPRLLSAAKKIVAFDLPGHGLSTDARNSEWAYGMRQYAEAALEVCRYMNLKQVVVLGWSLGGHIAIEMIPLSILPQPRGSNVTVKGIFIIGTPPVDPAANEIHKAFKFGPEPDAWRSALAASAELTEEQRHIFAHYCADPPYEPWMQACVDRADPRARKTMFEGFTNGTSASNQRKIVEDGLGGVLVGVLNGKDEPYVSVGFVREVEYANLWKHECLEWEGCLHAPFWAKPKEFEELFIEYLRDIGGYSTD
jgi:pimeloyl-ACP methyl ester carboxylesterase